MLSVGLPLVNLDTTTILLDVDGTLLDIVATPDAVTVPVELFHILEELLVRTSGALALVSGRSIRDLDRIFFPLKLPAIGCHGAEIRIDPALPAQHKAPLPNEIRNCVAALADPQRGILLEDKFYTLALHYRQAMGERDRLENAVSRCVAHIDPADIEVLDGKAVFEIKPSNFNKGSSVQELMQCAPFCGRRPVFIGDDVTDESAFAVLETFGGFGIAVGRQIRGAEYMLNSPNDVHEWLASILGVVKNDLANSSNSGGSS